MDCREASIFMQLAEDGETVKEELSALDSHLSTCLACRRMSAWLKALQENYPAQDPVGSDFADAVVRQLTQELAYETVHADTEIESQVATPKPRKTNRLLGRIWSLVTRGGRKRAKPEKRTGWSWKGADSRPLTRLGSHLLLGSLWSLVAGRRRKRVTPEKTPGWSSNAAGSMAFGFKSLRPALAPAVAGQSYATGWLRIAGSNLREKTRLRG